MNPMAEVMRYRKIKAQADAAQETQRLIDGALHMLSLNSNVRVTRVVAKSILLGSPWMWKGQALSVNGKHVGCGVWELRREEAATHKETKNDTTTRVEQVGQNSQRPKHPGANTLRSE